MSTSLSQAKPILFDEIPSGSIINKYSNDINILDKSLPEAASTTLTGILHFINLIGSVIYINNYFVLPVIIEVYLFYKWFIYIKSVLLRAKQLDLENKTPVFQFFQSSLSGLLIINVYGQKEQFQRRMEVLMNNSIRTYDVFWFISRLFSVYMQYAATLTSAVGIMLLLSSDSDNHGQFGQSLAFFLLLTNFLHLTLRSFINMDTFMTSSERAYTIINLPKENIDIQDVQPEIADENNQLLRSAYSKNYNQVQSTETNAVTIDIQALNRANNLNSLDTNNPEMNDSLNKGNLVFDKVYMRYKIELEHVLKGVSFHAEPLQRVAIVGRTGAGKSSIIQSLFRMSEIDISSAQGESRILYDNTNIRDIQLHKLRRSISIIPQTPFLFSGSIRRNIDPLQEYTDDQIIEVLSETGLYDLVRNLALGINTDMSDYNEVFSMGQRQLVCLARVMLRKNRLMVLDEATANVDMETDQKIQQLLKDKFKDTTIITIAHRLNTIADYDKIIVLDQGRVVEVGSSFELLANNQADSTITNTSSLFSQMVRHTGAKNADSIFQLSKASYLEKKKNH